MLVTFFLATLAVPSSSSINSILDPMRSKRVLVCSSSEANFVSVGLWRFEIAACWVF